VQFGGFGVMVGSVQGHGSKPGFRVERVPKCNWEALDEASFNTCIRQSAGAAPCILQA